MKIEKIYNERNAVSYQIDIGMAVEYLESRGYYEPGTVAAIMANSQEITLRTPWAFYHFTID